MIQKEEAIPQMEIDTYNIIKTSAGRKGVIEFTDGTRDYYTNIDIA